VCLNDWCINQQDCSANPERTAAFMQAYSDIRPLQAEEQAMLPALARAGALRFWISRLWDWHLPREASMLKPHDPAHFERVLKHRIHLYKPSN
jgi:homoserine kinase type II